MDLNAFGLEEERSLMSLSQDPSSAPSSNSESEPSSQLFTPAPVAQNHGTSSSNSSQVPGRTVAFAAEHVEVLSPSDEDVGMDADADEEVITARPGKSARVMIKKADGRAASGADLKAILAKADGEDADTGAARSSKSVRKTSSKENTGMLADSKLLRDAKEMMRTGGERLQAMQASLSGSPSSPIIDLTQYDEGVMREVFNMKSELSSASTWSYKRFFTKNRRDTRFMWAASTIRKLHEDGYFYEKDIKTENSEDPVLVTAKIKDEAFDQVQGQVDKYSVHGMTGVYDAADMTLLWHYNLRRAERRFDRVELFHGRKNDAKFKILELNPRQYSIHLVCGDYEYAGVEEGARAKQGKGTDGECTPENWVMLLEANPKKIGDAWLRGGAYSWTLYDVSALVDGPTGYKAQKTGTAGSGSKICFPRNWMNRDADVVKRSGLGNGIQFIDIKSQFAIATLESKSVKDSHDLALKSQDWFKTDMTKGRQHPLNFFDGYTVNIHREKFDQALVFCVAGAFREMTILNNVLEYNTNRKPALTNVLPGIELPRSFPMMQETQIALCNNNLRPFPYYGVADYFAGNIDHFRKQVDDRVLTLRNDNCHHKSLLLQRSRHKYGLEGAIAVMEWLALINSNLEANTMQEGDMFLDGIVKDYKKRKEERDLKHADRMMMMHNVIEANRRERDAKNKININSADRLCNTVSMNSDSAGMDKNASSSSATKDRRALLKQKTAPLRPPLSPLSNGGVSSGRHTVQGCSSPTSADTALTRPAGAQNPLDTTLSTAGAYSSSSSSSARSHINTPESQTQTSQTQSAKATRRQGTLPESIQVIDSTLRAYGNDASGNSHLPLSIRRDMRRRGRGQARGRTSPSDEGDDMDVDSIVEVESSLGDNGPNMNGLSGRARLLSEERLRREEQEQVVAAGATIRGGSGRPAGIPGRSSSDPEPSSLQRTIDEYRSALEVSQEQNRVISERYRQTTSSYTVMQECRSQLELLSAELRAVMDGSGDMAEAARRAADPNTNPDEELARAERRAHRIAVLTAQLDELSVRIDASYQEYTRNMEEMRQAESVLAANLRRQGTAEMRESARQELAAGLPVRETVSNEVA